LPSSLYPASLASSASLPRSDSTVCNCAGSATGNCEGSMVSRPSALAASRRGAEAVTNTILVPGNISRAASADPSCTASGQRRWYGRAVASPLQESGFSGLLHHARRFQPQHLQHGSRGFLRNVPGTLAAPDGRVDFERRRSRDQLAVVLDGRKQADPARRFPIHAQIVWRRR